MASYLPLGGRGLAQVVLLGVFGGVLDLRQPADWRVATRLEDRVGANSPWQ